MKGYWMILGTAVTDAEAQAEYGRLWAPIAARYGAKVIREGGPQLAEARQDTTRMLLVEFADLATAQACFNDSDYKAAAALTHKASSRDLVIFAGNL
ncbi:DUF1330 domain-containing protein [Xinfangfangia sp. CPCC 101601]|uniref:DUF1330 domain-containing protein n=1 Tax=Pseudogemmobacter lacusdianii TaxID=3069608 RepID=A0ABU0VUS7_9RHOB|nr:DUF1330 domain-containing protein [Xinfangfangia sp. CPCC 101601]MDQ2065472.1 DUF1330 domain-containing protein [Xinfangfangia sp. CPCC 101601]